MLYNFTLIKSESPCIEWCRDILALCSYSAFIFLRKERAEKGLVALSQASDARRRTGITKIVISSRKTEAPANGAYISEV